MSLEGSKVIRVHHSREACQQVARELKAHIFQGRHEAETMT